jgi:tRNA(fMet)-specific endonuclease VapC
MSSRKFLLDTDMVSYVLRNHGNAAAHLTSHLPSEVCISTITLSELRFGAEKRKSKKLHALIDTFVAAVEPLPFDSAAATSFGRVRAALESKGRPIGLLDALIASHALSLQLTLVTNNARHFNGVPGLRTVNWS